jgi:purine-cytosine permease-like protein
LTFIGFNVVTVVTIKQGLSEILRWNPNVVAVGVTLVAGALAIYGHDWIHSAVLTVFILSLPLWIVLTFGILTGRAGGHAPLIGGFNLVGVLTTFAVAASYNITYAPCVSDYSRYLAHDTSRRRITIAVFIGAVGSPLWLIPVGAWMATRLRVSDALTGIDVAGNSTVSHVGTVLVLVAVVTLLVAMAISAYSGMLSVLTIIDAFRPVHARRSARALVVVSLAAAWLILGVTLTNATSVLSDWLLFMLYLLAPWTSINLTDFYFVRRGRFAILDLFTPSGIYHRWGVRGLSAYAAGIVAEIPFVSIAGLYQSPGARWLRGLDVSWLVGLLVAGATYLYLARGLDHEAESSAIARSERTLLDEAFRGADSISTAPAGHRGAAR